MKETVTIERAILDFATRNDSFSFSQLKDCLGLNSNSVRQYLSRLFKSEKIDRIGNGVYRIHTLQEFCYIPSTFEIDIYKKLKKDFPLADFCVYNGEIFNPLQHHLAINHASYVETNRDGVDTVFNKLKEFGVPVFKHPTPEFIYDYVNLQEQCIIVKPLVTEAPVKEEKGITVPTLEKVIVDILRDPDLDYMRGSESFYMFRNAVENFAINRSKLLRYARRRGCSELIESYFKLIENQ